MNKHEIRKITSGGSFSKDGGATFNNLWRVKFRRYGIVDAKDTIVVEAKDEIEAFNIATKQLEKEI